MSESRRVVGRASGSLNAPIMFIGEAPGRLGADASALPFHGDRAGDNFEALLTQVGLTREDCFITNAVLCNPRDESGNNSTPTRLEISNCAAHLRRQIELVDPSIVVTLGAQSLNALETIEQHGVVLSEGVRTSVRWFGRALIPLYHPGQRAMLHRSFLNQLADYHFVAEALKRTKRPQKSRNLSASSDAVRTIILHILQELGSVTYFGLHKLFYLIENEHAKVTGERLTHSYIIRQKDGPYVVDLHFKKVQKAIPEVRLSDRNGKLIISLPQQSDLFASARLDQAVEAIVQAVLTRNGKKSDEELKRAAYLTAPMKRVLRREKDQRMNMLNAPLEFL